MTCLILAAGRGTRLARHSDSKPLTPLLGVPLIERVMLTAREAGATDFFVVTGYNGEKVRRFLDHFALREDIRIAHIKNDEWEKESGISVFKAKPFISENFILLMCDHLFDSPILARIQQETLCPGELIGSFPGQIALGWIALRGGSIWPALILHVIVGLTLEIAILLT